MLFEERAVEALDVAVGLGPPNLRGWVLDVLQLQEEFVGALSNPSPELDGRIGLDFAWRSERHLGDRGHYRHGGLLQPLLG
jgi:hypothetical protein